MLLCIIVQSLAILVLSKTVLVGIATAATTLSPKVSGKSPLLKKFPGSVTTKYLSAATALAEVSPLYN